MNAFVNIAITSIVLTTVLWLSRTSPVLAGFVLSLPISTLLVLPLAQLQNGDAGNTVMLAKSIFAGVPLTLTFFLPFLFVEKFRLSFWSAYGCGVLFLVISYFAHKWVMATWLK